MILFSEEECIKKIKNLEKLLKEQNCYISALKNEVEMITDKLDIINDELQINDYSIDDVFT